VLAHYGAVAMPCRIQDPDRKGKVESGVGHAQKTPLKGLSFESPVIRYSSDRVKKAGYLAGGLCGTLQSVLQSKSRFWACTIGAQHSGSSLAAKLIRVLIGKHRMSRAS
jgi:hypothetical protein